MYPGAHCYMCISSPYGNRKATWADARGGGFNDTRILHSLNEYLRIVRASAAALVLGELILPCSEERSKKDGQFVQGSPFFDYLADERSSYSDPTHPKYRENISQQEVSRLVGESWRSLSDAGKSEWISRPRPRGSRGPLNVLASTVPATLALRSVPPGMEPLADAPAALAPAAEAAAVTAAMAGVDSDSSSDSDSSMDEDDIREGDDGIGAEYAHTVSAMNRRREEQFGNYTGDN
ncbi:MAG: hypothetical protein WDW38_001392 [Sanguina aurantia]